MNLSATTAPHPAMASPGGLEVMHRTPGWGRQQLNVALQQGERLIPELQTVRYGPASWDVMHRAMGFAACLYDGYTALVANRPDAREAIVRLGGAQFAMAQLAGNIEALARIEDRRGERVPSFDVAAHGASVTAAMADARRAIELLEQG